MSHSLKNNGRRDPILTTSKTGEVLPSYFETDNAKLIDFLDAYYEFLDSDGQHGFGRQIRESLFARDIAETSTANLDEIIKEIGDGLQASSFFEQPRLMAKLLASFYRSKGTLVSAEGFFRGFFNEEATIEYPKSQIFIVGQDNIGFDSQKFIQDNKLYQIFSVLVKVGISTQDYEVLYKKFVHPAGFHFAGQVVSQTEASMFTAAQGLNPLDSDALNPVFASEATIGLTIPFSELTGLFDSSDGTTFRTSIDGDVISKYSTVTAQQLVNFYGSVANILDPNSFTFDDSDTTSRPDFSMTFETMDNFSFDSNVN